MQFILVKNLSRTELQKSQLRNCYPQDSGKAAEPRLQPASQLCMLSPLPDMTNEADNSDRRQGLLRESRRSLSRSEQSDLAANPLRRSKKNSHDGHHRRIKEKGENEQKNRTSVQRVAVEVKEEAGPFFFVDRKGDSQNVVYGGNHTGLVPRYRRAGYGSLIGVDRRYRISEDGSKASGINSTDDGRRRGYFSFLLNFRDNPRDGLEQVKGETIEAEFDEVRLQHDYITVGPNRFKRRKRSLAQGAVEGTQSIKKGRMEGTQRDENSPGGSDTASESESSARHEEDLYEKFRNDTQRQRSLELNRATLERPTDAEAWLTLIAHQDHIFDDYALRERSSTTVKQSLADIKLALYEKALSKVSDPKSRERLTEGLMDQGANVWDIETLSKKWQSVIQAISSADLWLHYANFRQTTPATFSYEECLSIQRDCLRRARGEADLAARDQMSIYLLLRSTMLMSQSGYIERAIAVWQALLEFTFFGPSKLDQLTEQPSFQAFWEWEVPRIGESGAVGWALSKPFEVPSRTDPIQGHSFPGDGYESWALREREVAAASTMPARTLDDVAEDDPFRVILYSDIEEYLFKPSTATGHASLINAFLKFCGLPALYYPGSQLHCRWWGDELLSPCIQRDRPSLIEGSAVSDTMMLFHAESSLSVFPAATSKDGRAKAAWQRKALKQVAATLVDDDVLAEYVIAFEASLDLKEGRKYAKSLLKSRPSNLRLYNAYALLECRLDRFESAEHIWSTAINMSQSASTNEQQDVMLLWSSWVCECLQQANLSKAITIVSSMPDGRVATERLTPDTFSNAAIRLRAKNYLASHLSQQLSLRQETLVCHLTELLAIFEYLSGSHSISAALTVYRTTFEALTKIPTSSLLIEVLHQSRARLLHIHPTLSPRGYRPAEINRHLAESLCNFPGNSMFHQLYQEHTQRTGLLERIRDVVPVNVSTSGDNNHGTSIVPYLFAIERELCRPSYAGSTNHSIRAAFERGVAATKACVGIWGWYIKWETSLNNETASEVQAAKPRKKEIEPRRNKAVDVYYRGIRACPWAKELYMLGFSEVVLCKAIGSIELRKIYDVMLEKGLRLHVDLDQMVK